MANRKLPSTKELIALSSLIHFAFVDIRNYISNEPPNRFRDLAQAFCNIPGSMHDVDLWDLEKTRKKLEQYHKLHPKSYYHFFFEV